MTYEQKKAWKELSSELFKWVFLAFVLGWLTNQVFFAPTAKAALVVPKVMEFTYKTTADQTIHVNTWINDGVQCTALSTDIRRNTEIPLAVSCVKL